MVILRHVREDSAYTKPADLDQGRLKTLAMGIAIREPEHDPHTHIKQAGWEHEDFASQGKEPRGLPASRQADAVEPFDQIVGEQDRLEMHSVGEKTSRGNQAQRKGFPELADARLGVGPICVEPIDRRGAELQVRHKRVIQGVLALPEDQLGGLFGSLGLGPSHHHEPPWLVPRRWLEGDGSNLPLFPLAERAEAQPTGLLFQESDHPGNDDIPHLSLVDKLHEPFGEEADVPPKSHGQQLAVDIRGELGLTGSEELSGGARQMRIPRLQQPGHGRLRLRPAAGGRAGHGADLCEFGACDPSGRGSLQWPGAPHTARVEIVVRQSPSAS